MMKEKRPLPAFTSAMSLRELAAALLWLPIQLWLIPALAAVLMEKGLVNEMQANFLCYALGTLNMLLTLWHFFRRDFDPLWEAPFYVISEVCGCYLLMLVMNMGVALLMSLLMPVTENPNNQAVMSLTELGYGQVAAMTVFLAPLVEEPVFRGAIFSGARRFNRAAAYALSMLIFSLYHVWPYAVADGIYWLFLIQYLPVSYLLCRCYERCNSIWGSIFLHMLINAVSLSALAELEKLL